MNRFSGIFGTGEKPQPQSEDSFGMWINSKRRVTFLQYLNHAWLLFGIVTLVSLPFFPKLQYEFGFLVLVIFPSYLLNRFLLSSGRSQLAGVIFTLAVDICFYSLFIYLTRQLGAEKAFETESTVWMLMGLAVLFAGAFVDK